MRGAPPDWGSVLSGLESVLANFDHKIMRLSSSPLLFLLGTFSTRAGAKSGCFGKILFTCSVMTIFPDWKPIASSRDPSYIDYFGLDQSQGSFEGKTPEIERLTGKISSSTDGYSRQERIHPWSPQTLNSWPGTQPRRWDNTKNMCKELLCGPGGPIMTTISWWGGVEESPMRRWRRWWRRTLPWKRLVLSIEVEELTQKEDMYNFKHQTTLCSPLSNCRCSTLWWRWRWSPDQRGLPWLLPRSLLLRWWSCSYLLFLVFTCFMFELCADHLSELHLLPQLQPGKPHRCRWLYADQHYSEWSSLHRLWHNWSSIQLAFIKLLIPLFVGLWPEGILATGKRRWTFINSQHLRVNKCCTCKIWPCSFSTSWHHNLWVDIILICRVYLQRRSRPFPFQTTFDFNK